MDIFADIGQIDHCGFDINPEGFEIIRELKIQ